MFTHWPMADVNEGGRTWGRRSGGAVCRDTRRLAGGAQAADGSAGGGEHMVSSWLPSSSGRCVPAVNHLVSLSTTQSRVNVAPPAAVQPTSYPASARLIALATLL